VQRRRSAAGLIRMAERYYPPAEARFVAEAADDPDELGRRFSTLWTRKEACAKVGGGRLIPTLGWPSRQPNDPESAEPIGLFRSGDPAEPVLIRDLAMPDDFHGAVAVAGSDDFEVTTHWWTPELGSAGCPMTETGFVPAQRPPSDAQMGVSMAVPEC
jgi:4'-phosphopantetheinyl transferase